MVGGAGDQHRGLTHVQTAIEHKIERTTKRAAALIVGKAHLAQRHLTRKAVQRIHPSTAPGIKIAGHNHRTAVMSNLIANGK